MGTAGYMSPEQARGQAVDKRTDIWAFGACCTRCSRDVAFAGETMSDTIVAVLGSEPDWNALPAATPASVRALLQRCLEKDPKRRVRDFGDVRFDVDERDEATRHRTDARHRIERSVWLHRSCRAARSRGALFYATRPSTPVTAPSEYVQLTNFTDSAAAPSLSPDGRMLAFKRSSDAFLSQGQIHVKLLPNGESVQLTNDSDQSTGRCSRQTDHESHTPG